MHVKPKFYLVLLLVLSIQFIIYAQQQNVLKGYVFNAETGEPVPNANVILKDTKTGASSDNRGFFSLTADPGTYILRVTSVGFSEQEISVTLPNTSDEPLHINISPKKIGIESVDVFGDLFLTGRDSAINRVPLSILPAITKISAVEIEKQGAVTLIDAVKYVPGGWTESRGRKTKQFFSVRGQKYPYPNYSIDGIWQKEFEETGYFFSALDIESVEIVRSSNALIKGLSGLTGVIDVKTKRPEKETASLLAKYGGLNSYATKIQYGNKLKELSFNTSASLFGTDGPPRRKGKERIANFHGTIDWNLTDKLNLMAGSAFINGSREFVNIVEPGAPNIANREEKFDPLSTLITYLKFDYKADNGSETELQMNYTYRDVEHSSYNIVNESTTIIDEKDWEYGFNILHSRPLSSSNTLRLGGLYNHWEAPNGKRYYVGRSCNVHTWSGVIADEQKVGRFLFDAGFRIIGGYIVEWGGFGIEGSAAGFQNVEPVEDETAPFEWQSAAGVTYMLSNALSFHYNFSGGTIAPRKGSLSEEGTSPETEGRFQYDIGFRYKCPRDNEFSVSTFYTKRRNAIDYSGNTVTTDNDMVLELYENLDKRSYGLELATKINVPAVNSIIFGNAMIMKGEKESEDKMIDDNQLPKIILNGGVSYEKSVFDASLFMHYTGPYSNNRFVNPSWVAQNGDFPLGDFISADITAGYTFSGRFPIRIFGEVKNILNEEYQTVAGYPDAGRLFNLGLKINY